MGLGVPPGPPLVRASINPRTTVLLLAVPNSSKVYLEEISYLKKKKKVVLFFSEWLYQTIHVIPEISKTSKAFFIQLSQAILF